MNKTASAVLIGLALILLAFTQVLDNVSQQGTESALKRSLATYAIVRTLNGLISVAQGTEVALEPAGVGVVLTPGQILDPVNDLIERFSWILLLSSAALGTMQILLGISSWIWLSIFMTMFVLASTWLFTRRETQKSYDRIIVKVTLLLVIVRFSAPAMMLINEMTYQQFLAPVFQSSLSEFESARNKINEYNQHHDVEPVIADDSILDKVKNYYDSTKSIFSQKLNIEKQLQQLNTTVADITHATINLIVVFCLQSVVIPLACMWLLWFIIKQVIRSPLKFSQLPMEQ